MDHDNWTTWHALAEQVSSWNACLGHLAMQRLWRHASSSNSMVTAWEQCDPDSALEQLILKQLREQGEPDEGWDETLLELAAEENNHSDIYELGLQIKFQRACTFSGYLDVWQRAPLESYYRQAGREGA
ncbi:MAG: hypothetical protein Q8R28_19680, partial [Dehalococcoidia bacterium]|nr:hypothetical protein [Dehalococcoidia bacterium]